MRKVTGLCSLCLVASVAAAEVRIAHPNLDYFPPAQLQLVLGQLATLETQVGDWIFAPGPVAWDWGSYELEEAKLEVVLEEAQRTLRYQVVFIGVRRYHSPKYGFSIRAEYLLKSI